MEEVIFMANTQQKEIEQAIAEKYYFDDNNSKNNADQALYWFQKSAKEGNMESQFNLAALYYNGEVVERDILQSLYWFQRASEQGCEDSEYHAQDIKNQLREICAKQNVPI